MPPERIRSTVEATPIPFKGAEIRITVSVGFAFAEVGVATTLEAMHDVAVVDVEDALTAESPAAAMHAVVVGTVMVDPVLLALRRVAQEAVSAQRA